MNKNAWMKYDGEKRKDIMALADRFTNFISDCKTERECVTKAIEMAKSNGFKSLDEVIKSDGKLKPNDKIYYAHHNKSVVLMIVGQEALENGVNILGAHIDSPRIDIKANPLYEDHDVALLDTHYYGGIKKYQWVTIPLALHGVVCKKDGTTVNICIGEDDSEPCVGITDLLPHLAARQMQKKASEVVDGEGLNISVGSIPADEKGNVKETVLNILKEKYDIEEEDFLSAEIEAVPAGRARSFGLDNSMILGYGQDDRICSYASLEAIMETTNPTKSSVVLLVDKEEIGSVGAVGMASLFFENFMAEVMELVEGFSELKLKRCLQNSDALSNDVSIGFDPNYPEVSELKNTAFIGYGLGVNKFTGSRGKSGSNDASAEYVAKLRRLFEENEVSWQSNELGRVDEGGGGTIAYHLAKYGMNVIDTGVPVQSMHAPYEVTSKVDLFEAKKAYVAFLKNN